MWIIVLMAILMGILEIRYAYKVEKDSNSEPRFSSHWKKVFISMGVITIILGFILFILCYV